MKIKKGDNVIVTAGKDRGKKAKVLRALPSEGKLVIEGVNVRKVRVRRKKANEKGQTVDRSLAINASNAMLFCSSCGKGVRVKAKMDGKKKVRACVSCSKEL